MPTIQLINDSSIFGPLDHTHKRRKNQKQSDIRLSAVAKFNYRCTGHKEDGTGDAPWHVIQSKLSFV